jgi:uncharacterized protein (TIGR02996 family)
MIADSAAELLQAALRQDLRDEASWSVYADWLSSQGDSRGELIGYEQRAERETDPERAREWRQRAKQLFERDHQQWLGPLRNITMKPTWTRGFVTEVVLHDPSGTTASTLLRMRTGALLYRLTFTRLADCQPVAEALRGSWIETLELRGLATTKIEPLAAIERLRELFLVRCKVDDLAALAELPALERLIIEDSKIDLDAFERGFAALRHLVLARHGQHLRASERYLDLSPLARLAGLEILDLNRSRVEDLGPLKWLTQLRQLDISDTDVRSLEPLYTVNTLQRVDAIGLNMVLEWESCEPLRARGVRVERQPKSARLGPP